MPRRIVFAATSLIVLFAWTEAYAQVCTVRSHNDSKTGILTRPGKSGEFDALVQAKMIDEAVRCCVSCIVPVGTKIVITDRGFLSSTVRVVEGRSRNCIGDLPQEYVDCPRP